MGAGIIQFDYGYQRESVHVRAVPSMEALTAFCAVIKQYSNAGIRKMAYTETTFWNERGQDLPSQDVDAVLIVQFEYYDSDAQLRTTTFPLPAPVRTKLEFIDGRGYRLPEADGNLIAEAYSAMTGTVVTYRDGWVLA